MDFVGQGRMPQQAIDPRSRYFELSAQPAVHEDEHGRQVPYLRRRFLPQGQRMPLLTQADPMPGDRLDLIAARTLGDSQLFWRICDACDAMNPFDLIAEQGRALRVPLPLKTAG